MSCGLAKPLVMTVITRVVTKKPGAPQLVLKESRYFGTGGPCSRGLRGCTKSGSRPRRKDFRVKPRFHASKCIAKFTFAKFLIRSANCKNRHCHCPVVPFQSPGLPASNAASMRTWYNGIIERIWHTELPVLTNATLGAATIVNSVRHSTVCSIGLYG